MRNINLIYKNIKYMIMYMKYIYMKKGRSAQKDTNGRLNKERESERRKRKKGKGERQGKEEQ